MTDIDAPCSKSQTTHASESNIKLEDISNLIFSYPITYHGTIEMNPNESSISSFMDSVGKSVLLNHLKYPQNFESIPAYIYRNDASNNSFYIRKNNNKNSDMENITSYLLNDIVAVFSLEFIHEKLTQYTCIILQTKTSSSHAAIVIAFKEHETKYRAIRSLQFCQAVIQQNNTEDGLHMKIEEETFIYSLIHLQSLLEIYESENLVDYSSVPHKNNTFKLRENVPKIIEISIKPTNNCDFLVDRCFGTLYSTNIDDIVNMTLFDKFDYKKISDKESMDGVSHIVRVLTIPNTEPFAIFKTSESHSSFNIAADFVIKGIVSPIRLIFKFKAKIFSQTETFFIINRNPIITNTIIFLKRNSDSSSTDLTVVDIDEIAIGKSNSWKPTLDLIFPSKQKNPDEPHGDIQSIPTQYKEIDENDVVLSGTYSFDLEMNQEIMSEWCTALDSWKLSNVPPQNLQKLLKTGVPCPYRKTVWPLLLGVYDVNHKSYQLYKKLINETSEYEKVILRDVNRTFPAHDYFKESNGPGQQQLYRVCKAYSVYDPDVGYCQGLSFIVADLLLHVDEDTAFAILVELMYSKNHRELFTQAFEQLHANLYVLKRLTLELIPELGKHLSNLGVEPHMYAPQWLLTIFTAKFPLGLVDQALDMMFSLGKRSILQISLALLTLCQKEIMNLNFENTLKYFRLNMPKKFTNPCVVKNLFHHAHSLSISSSLIDEILLDFQRYKKDMIMTQDPLLLAKSENKMLFERQLRLEQENDLLAQELITTQIHSKRNTEELTEKNLELLHKIETYKAEVLMLQELNNHLKNQEGIIKDELSKQLQSSEDIIYRKDNLILHYKNVCSNLENKEKQFELSVSELHEKYYNILKKCDNCCELYKSVFSKNSDGSNDDINLILNKEAFDDKKRAEQLEMELAITKMRAAETESKNEELIHLINQLNKEANKSWIQKLNTNIRK